jgi:hypothetical protein
MSVHASRALLPAPMWPRLREDAMSDIRRTLEALCEAFNAHDLDAVMAHLADDRVLEMPRGPDPWGARSEGKTAVRTQVSANERHSICHYFLFIISFLLRRSTNTFGLIFLSVPRILR